ncbi:MAG: tRNA lysidine(34) synthetase TilS [Phycisphaerales bacterium]|nr:MAG: tRNA lysidine(34) synthetase TilS [Phycisphaerales bacterium]
MLKALGQELLSEGLLAQDDTVVVGVSGGPDSMALLYLLVGLNEELEWRLKLHVCHLNHQLRGDEAEKDAAFVQAAADSLSLPCTIEACDISALAEAESVGVEEVSRRERYVLFERVCLQIGSKVVAVGHHADDNAETILHRILRGTGLRGLSGIPRSRLLNPDSDVRVIRPLLRTTRESLCRYLANAGIAYREDRTNILNEPMRNRIRNVVLPQIEAEVNPQVRDALTRLAEQAHWLEEYLGETVQRTFETLIISRTDQVLSLNADALLRKSRIVQTELIRLAYRSFELGEQDLSFGHLVSALELIADPASGKQLQLPGGMTVEKRYHQLIFSLPSDEPRETISAEIAVHLPGHTLLPIRRLEIDCSVDEVSPGDIPRLRRVADRMEEYLDLEAVHPPLVVRRRRPGDRFCPLGAPGSKKLSDFLIDAKVDPKERDRVAVLCDQLGPVWVIGHRIDDRVKLTELTRRVLHLRARPLGP